MDFVADAYSWGRRFRILCIVDDFTREALALVVNTSISGLRMARELDTLIARRGRPATIVSDNVLYAEALGGDVRRSLSGSMAVGGIVVNTSKRLPPYKDELSSTSNTGYVDAGVAALTILNTRYLYRRKARALRQGRWRAFTALLRRVLPLGPAAFEEGAVLCPAFDDGVHHARHLGGDG